MTCPELTNRDFFTWRVVKLFCDRDGLDTNIWQGFKKSSDIIGINSTLDNEMWKKIISESSSFSTMYSWEPPGKPCLILTLSLCFCLHAHCGPASEVMQKAKCVFGLTAVAFYVLGNETDYADELHSLSEGSTPVPKALDVWSMHFQSTVPALLVLRALGLLGAKCPAARLQNKKCSCELPHQHLILERSPFHITKKEGENIRKKFPWVLLVAKICAQWSSASHKSWVAAQVPGRVAVVPSLRGV